MIVQLLFSAFLFVQMSSKISLLNYRKYSVKPLDK
nr:MAG TPA: hypothetical protein [Caudoviricetes sp.]